MANEYTKKIRLIFEDLGPTVKTVGKGFAKSFYDALIKDSSGIQQLSQGFSNGFAGGLTAAGNMFLTSLGTLINDSWKELKSILKYSQLTDSSVRNLRFQYGLSSSQAYAASKAGAAIGLQSEEDFYYMDAQQRKAFYEKFESYADKYENLLSSGFFKDLEEYQLEMADFREEMQLEVIRFFVDNKDMIKQGFVSIVELSKFTINALSKVVTFLGGKAETGYYERQRMYESIVNQNNSKSVTMNNNYNINGGGVDVLNNLGQMTYTDALKVIQSGGI